MWNIKSKNITLLTTTDMASCGLCITRSLGTKHFLTTTDMASCGWCITREMSMIDLSESDVALIATSHISNY